MPGVTITRKKFLEDSQGRRFADVVNDPEQTFDVILDFFNDDNRQRRMMESPFIVKRLTDNAQPKLQAGSVQCSTYRE